jgi:membrane-associated phospholipid phosphatase
MLNAHTPVQVYTGTTLGFIICFLSIYFFVWSRAVKFFLYLKNANYFCHENYFQCEQIIIF